MSELAGSCFAVRLDDMMHYMAFASLMMLPIACSQSSEHADEHDVESLIQRASEHANLGKHDEAINFLDEAIRLDPNNAYAFACRGVSRFSKKEYVRAISDLDEAIRLKPGVPSSVYNTRGSAWYMKKEYAKGVKDFDEAIRLDPKDAGALNGRAWAAATCPEAKFRDRAKALEYGKRTCELDGWKNPFGLGTLAAAYAENDDFENAIKWQRKAMESELYVKEYGEKGREMLKLFEQHKAYREESNKNSPPR